VAPANWTGFTVNRTAETQYVQNRKVRLWVREGAAGTVQTLTEYSYDEQGRPTCTAVRMNRAAFVYTGTPTACAATPGAPGTPPTDDSRDRITKIVYDNLGRRVQALVGVGYPGEEAAEASWAHNLNGQIIAVTDGNGNRAELRYDGHMRQDRWTFPSASGPPGTVNAADYEEYAYDAAGNRTSLRKRDGSLLGYSYDNLNRLILKIVPERPSGAQALHPSQTRDVHYAYDLRNLPLHARFDSQTGDGVTNSYDGFGRMLTQRIQMGATDRTLFYQYREDGARTRITHPDGTYFALDVDVAGRLGAVRENGAASGPGVPVQVGWSPEGYLGAMVRSNGAIDYWGYDGIGRMNVLGHYAGATADYVQHVYARNPASGIASQSRDNDAFAWAGHYAVTRAYAVNGLNQYKPPARPGSPMTRTAISSPRRAPMRARR